VVVARLQWVAFAMGARVARGGGGGGGGGGGCRLRRLWGSGAAAEPADPPFSGVWSPPVCIRSTMAPSFPSSNKTSSSPFLLSKGSCEAGKQEKKMVPKKCIK